MNKPTDNNTFKEDLEFSHQQSHKDYWQEAYAHYFNDPDITQELIVPIGNKSDTGVDKHITLSNGKVYSVDEKVHKAREGIAPDTYIFLEYRNLWENGYESVGWANCPVKSTKCDYIAYFKESLNVVYMIPLDPVQLLLKDYEERGQAFGESVWSVTDYGNTWYGTYSWMIKYEDLAQRLLYKQQCPVNQ